MNRRSGFGLSMLLMSLWMGQTALTGSAGTLSVSMGIMSATLACFGGAILSGIFEPETIPDEEISSLATRVIATMFTIGLIASLLLLILPYV